MSSDYINEGEDGLYRGFGYQSLISEPIDKVSSVNL